MSFSSERADTLVGMRANMRAFYRMVGEQSPDGRLFEREGVSAAIAPSCPHRSVVNAVVYESADALASAHAELRAEYEASGVRAWTVWVPEADAGVARLLRTAGHSLDARPRAMTVELASMDLSGTGGDIEVDRGYDAAALAALNEEAHRLPSGSFARVMTAFTGPPATVYIARIGGSAVACALAVEAGRDCGIYMVATAPSARRRGLATGLVRRALRDARDGGATTGSLQATQLGRSIYERLGFRDDGAIEMWERRLR